jgi:hypothetical protein
MMSYYDTSALIVTQEANSRSFTPANGTRREPPTKDNPVTFVLQKLGIAEPLIPLSTGGIKVPKDGTPVSIDLVL